MGKYRGMGPFSFWVWIEIHAWPMSKGRGGGGDWTRRHRPLHSFKLGIYYRLHREPRNSFPRYELVGRCE